MILNIALILSCLVAFNFILLIFSCNKSTKKVDFEVTLTKKTKKTPKKTATLVSNQLESNQQLAPIGS